MQNLTLLVTPENKHPLCGRFCQVPPSHWVLADSKFEIRSQLSDPMVQGNLHVEECYWSKYGGKHGIITWQPVDLPASIATGNLLNWEPRAEKLKLVSAEFRHVVGRKRRKFNFFSL